jgi:hypothetical protein
VRLYQRHDGIPVRLEGFQQVSRRLVTAHPETAGLIQSHVNTGHIEASQ